jgi:tetratricopeptide (TPR) repeat protein
MRFCRRIIKNSLSVSLCALLFCASSALSAAIAQVPRKAVADFTADAHKGIQFASSGQCDEALPLLRKSVSRIADRQLTYDAAMAMAQCGMSTDQEDAAVDALLLLRRDFPHDPKVLYTTTHFYSELAMRSAHELVAVAPHSAEVQELNAEAFESQGKLDEAEKAYRQILEQYPQQPGIHYRIGRIILDEPQTETSAQEARKEFEAELKIDPTAASAEFMLGDLDRQSQEWSDAIEHFGRAAQLDTGFSEAFLGLGISLNAAGKHADAVAPLEKYVKMEPSDPAGHYQLAIAYARTGRMQDANREIALQHEAEKKVHETPRDPSSQN